MSKSNGRHVADNRHRFLFAAAGRRSMMGSCDEALGALQEELDNRGLSLLEDDPADCKQVGQGHIGGGGGRWGKRRVGGAEKSWG